MTDLLQVARTWPCSINIWRKCTLYEFLPSYKAWDFVTNDQLLRDSSTFFRIFWLFPCLHRSIQSITC
jgi:hypothetical protein